MATERDLVGRAKKGDGDAFTALTRPYHQRLYETACFLTNDPDEAEDLAQECLIKAYLSIRRFREGAPLLPWLLKILKNLFIDSRRSGKSRYEVRTALAELEEMAQAAGNGPLAQEHNPSDALEQILRKERQSELRELISALPAVFALTLVLVDVQGFSYAEAAEATGTRVNTVRTRLFRARALLRRWLLSGRGTSGP